MYKISGITFFDNDDSDDKIIEAYTDIKRTSFEEANMEFDEDEAKFEAKRFIESSYKNELVYSINAAKSYESIQIHENHWLKFLRCFGFPASIVSYKMTGLYIASMTSGIAMKENMYNFISYFNGFKFLRIGLVSHIKNDNGENLVISRYFLEKMKNQFVTYQDENYFYIKYAPSKDAYVSMVLTRSLHLLL